MNGSKLIFNYSQRIIRREWRRFVLPALSLGITAAVLSSTLFLTEASQALLAERARFLQGGDVVLESTNPLNVSEVLAPTSVVPERSTEILEFSSSLQSSSTATAVSLQVVDSAYPLYGSIGIKDGSYSYLSASQIYLDQKAAERLQVSIGDTVQFGEGTFAVAGVIENDPTSLLGGFRFLPRALLSKEGFTETRIDTTLLRAEYEYALVIPNLTKDQSEAIRAIEVESDGFIQARIASDGGGLAAGLDVVRDFLVIAILITAILAAVNVYASTVYFIRTERKSFAILLSLGLTRLRLIAVIGTTLAVVVLLASIFGVAAGYGAFLMTSAYIASTLAITLPQPHVMLYGLLTVLLIAVLAFGAFIPTVQTVLGLSPKQLLTGEELKRGRDTYLFSLLITISTFLPIVGLSIFLLESWTRGVITITAVIGTYLLVMVLFSGLLTWLWRMRTKFSFMVRAIISQKRADGLFGIVSFTSLFLALTVLSTLVLLQATLSEYLTRDLSATVPSSYVIDIQASQVDGLKEQFPEVELFSNTPARIVAIDAVQIQAGIAAGDPSIDRELGREFNITARDTLLESEAITEGVWHEGRPGEISVDEDFAKRANISLGSRVVLSVQGFEVVGTVTSIRSTDSRSGLPFFFFVLSPQDIASFPKTYFGYAYQDTARQQSLNQFLAADMPNATVIETETLAPLLIGLTELLLLIVVVVTIPPLLIATLLIVTMIISSYTTRRRESGRLRALGASKKFVTKLYLGETVTITALASLAAYGVSVVATHLLATNFLQVSTTVWFDVAVLGGLGVIVGIVLFLAILLIKSDTMPLRELLSYGE